MTFDVYAFADYSASSPVREQRKHIVLAIYDRATDKHTVIKDLSRVELWIEMATLLDLATSAGQRVLFGFDHSYSFPSGFFQTLTNTPWGNWYTLLQWLRIPHEGIPQPGEPIPPALYRQLANKYDGASFATSALNWLEDAFQGCSLPREWAESVNRWFSQNYLEDYRGGPFWGPNFQTQVTKPSFPFGEGFQEKRLVEEYSQKLKGKAMKSIYQIGGNGSVGLQALYGISYLHQLLLFSEHKDIPIFCWPFDGWSPTSLHHVLTEVYPTLYNYGSRSDEEDAMACVTWMKEHDERGGLFERPAFLSGQESDVARLEGWVPGV